MINKKEIDILKKELNRSFDNEIIEKLNLWEEIFLEYNSHTNLMSKNDTQVLFEKHVFDSLSILKWENFFKHKKILDVGTGGGFPSVILAICNPEVVVYANDSRIKKINFIKEAKQKLKLDNLEILYSRIEDVEPLKVDLIVSRAVGKITDVFELSKKHLIKDGVFLIYKSKTSKDEIQEFLNKYSPKKIDILPYQLPLKENFDRNLVIINY